MKKITFFVGVSLVCIGSTMLSCSKSEVTPPPVEKAVKVAEPFESEIALREKELGVTYFKKNVVLTDKSGKNKVIMQYASLDEAGLNDYLATREYEIIPILKGQSPSLLTRQPVAENSNNVEPTPSNGKNLNVIAEVISQELQNGVTGYSVNVKYNSKNKLNGSRVAGIYGSITEELASNEDWAERFHFARYGDAGMHYFLKHKNGGVFQNFQTADDLYQVNPLMPLPPYGLYGPGSVHNDFKVLGGVGSTGAYPVSGQEYIYEIDGPKKFILWIEHNGRATFGYYFEQL